ncbi:LysR family transcriptional regulator [Longispora fulva]|uniref:DNA-binding transcriptional LysR family regulator n=1 Tax=Longispora fulva TaxID=619741 RepID=A0A8J7GL98_9ACTN|nr:LysR family transcriptional regulator [Longispora fulva]MBG6141729.1 DNA-binding transcriptional LysR family regulator [Longispora fulva]GIG59116.1 LysR family transcriptional regulator [Longispora fulva]
MIDTRQLEMFAAVVRAGSFSAAARELNCSQPAISQQMRALERHVGGPLFLRVGRGLRLTEAGRILAERGKAVLDELAVTHQQVRAVAALDFGTVRICAFPSANASIVPGAAAALSKERPRLRLELIEKEPPDSFDLLRHAECELVIGFSYADEDEEEATAGMLRVPLLEDRLALLLPAGHPFAGRDRVDLAEMAGERWIAGCPRCCGAFVRACERAGFTPDIACATDDNMAIQSLVAAGLGVALVPMLVLSFLRHGSVVAVPVESTIRRRTAVYTWPDLIRVPVVRATIDALVTVAHQA